MKGEEAAARERRRKARWGTVVVAGCSLLHREAAQAESEQDEQEWNRRWSQWQVGTRCRMEH